MKSGTLKYYAYSFIVFISVLAAVSSLLAAILINTDLSGGREAYAGCAAAAAATLISCIYARKKTAEAFSPLICSILFALIMLCFSFTGAAPENALSFASPIVCICAGAAVYLIDSKRRSVPRKKRSSKYRR